MQDEYDVILADPCWSYENFRESANGAAVSAYSCMSIEDICAIPVQKWAAKNCVLALWSTAPMIAQGNANKVIDAWGFSGKTMVGWLKNSPTTQDLATGVGIWFMANQEFCLFATRGKVGGFFEKKAGEKPKKLRGGNLGVLVGERDDPEFWKRLGERAIIAPKDRKHSRKPTNTLHEYLETFGPRRLELFAREKREGWSSFGLDLGSELGPWGVRKTATQTGAGLF